MSKSKIKIVDDSNLRNEIEIYIEFVNHVDLAQWAINIAKHISHLIDEELSSSVTIEESYKINEIWQNGEATVHQVREAGFKVHKIARECRSEIAKAAIRSAGQAVSVGHMRDHAIVSSDYAIKAIGLAYQNDIDKITEERQWQLNELKKYSSNRRLKS